MKISYFLLAFSLVVVCAGVSFADTANDPMIIFGKSEPGTGQITCTSPNTCTFDSGTNPEIFFTNDTDTTFDSFVVTIDTPFVPNVGTGPAITCELADEEGNPFSSASFVGPGSCRFSGDSLFPDEDFHVQFNGFVCADATSQCGFTFNAPATVPEPSPFVLLGTGLVAALVVGRKRTRAVKPTWAL